MSTELEDARAYIAHLERVNVGLAAQVSRISTTLENGKRELLAAGWDAACDHADNSRRYGASLKRDNPYRKPLPSIGDPA